MKKRRPLPLYDPIEPDSYLIDTSAWLNIDLRADREDVWTAIISLIQQGRAFTCSQVIAEIRDDPIFPSRLKPHEEALLACEHGLEQVTYLMHVGKVTNEHRGMSKPMASKTPADPYVIALGELQKLVVVADETCNNRPNRKIPGVCHQRKIKCLTLEQFVTALVCGKEKVESATVGV